MLFNTKTQIPQVYSKERDMQVLNKLIDIILTCCKYDIDKLGYVYEPMNCPKQLLPLLAYTLNYNYNFEDTVSSNRRIIDVFSTMEKYRGCEIGLKMATALSLTSLDVAKDNAEWQSDEDYLYVLRDLNIHYDYETATIYIDYPNIYSLVRYLLDYVRPVGMYLKLRSVVPSNINTDTLLIYATTDSEVRVYQPEIDSGVGKSFVNFSGIADDAWMEQFAEVDELDFNE